MLDFLRSFGTDALNALPGPSVLAQLALLIAGKQPGTDQRDVAPSCEVIAKGRTGRLPTLGWNSWGVIPDADMSSDRVFAAAQDIVSTGLCAAGYQYVNMDSGWQSTARTSSGDLLPDPTRFPQGIKPLADQVHGLNLALGIYSSASPESCNKKYPGSLGYEEIDSTNFGAWDVDFLKYDNCHMYPTAPPGYQDEYVACAPYQVNMTSNATCNTELDPRLAPADYDWSTSVSAQRYMNMSKALALHAPKVLFNICILGLADVFSWGNQTGISWRMSTDNKPRWERIMRITSINSFRMNSVNFGGHNDADGLQIGNVGKDPPSELTFAESRSHMALWAAMKSPLIINTNVTVLKKEKPTFFELLTNKYLLAFNQDEVHGKPAIPIKWDWTFDEMHPPAYWAGASNDGFLLLMLNTGGSTKTMHTAWSDVPGLKNSCGKTCSETSYEVTDVWTGETKCMKGSASSEVESHDTQAFLVGSSC